MPDVPRRDQPSLLAFALRHAVVTPFIGSRQHTDDDSYLLKPRTCPDYNLIYVWEGAARWTVEDVEHPLVRGDLIIVPPGVPHHGRSAAKVMSFGSVHLLAELPGGQDVLALFRLQRVRPVAVGSRLDRVFRHAMEEYDRPYALAWSMLPAWTTLIFKELLLHDEAAGLIHAGRGDPVVDGILQHLEHNLGRRITLAELAERSGYTAQHLNRRFTRALGMTPLTCLAGLRMERAATLLREGRLSVQAVGETVGFDDPAYFSRAFRAHFGRSPSEARKQAGSENPS
jgi:AraC-like DNA-binding protein